jgi:hypothetical protein
VIFDPDNTCLDKAKSLVMGDRQDDYGHPLDDFQKVTDAAKALGIDPAKGGPLHHSLYMVLVKIARLMESPGHEDSVVDGPGYFLTYERVYAEKLKRLEDFDAPRGNPANEKLETLRELYTRNPERFDAEIGIYLTPEQRADVRG